MTCPEDSSARGQCQAPVNIVYRNELKACLQQFSEMAGVSEISKSSDSAPDRAAELTVGRRD